MVPKPEEDTPFHIIQMMTRILLATQKPWSKRAFAGRSVGKGRDPHAPAYIARQIAHRFLWPIEFRDGDVVLGKQEITEAFERILRSIPDDEAFLLASKSYEENEASKKSVAMKVATILTTEYQTAKIDRTDQVLARSMGGPKHSDIALEALRRKGSLVPRYKWRRAAGMFDPIFAGFDAGVEIGRIWYDYPKGGELWWQWQCTIEMPRVLNSPPYGGADIERQAARDLEDYYDRLKEHNRAMGSQLGTNPPI